MATRRVWYTPTAGNIGNLRQKTEPLGEVAPGQVRVRTRAVGLNFADIFALVGLYSATPRGAFVPGLELAGEVEAVGKEVSDTDGFAIGDRVMAVTRFGAYASSIDVDPADALPLPGDWDFACGAAFPVQTLTAWYALKELGDARPGRLTLVHSAAGGVGLRALELCRGISVPVIGTVGAEDKKRFLEQRGFEEIIVRRSPPYRFARQLAEHLGGRPLHLVLDGIGGRVQKLSYEALAPSGRLVVYGAAEFTPGPRRPRYLDNARRYLVRPRYDVLKMMSDNKSVMAFNLIWMWEERELLRRSLKDIEALSLPPPHVGHRYPFDDVFEALEMLRGGRSTGKVVLTID
jgi:alcohol dehydrogenase